MQTLSLLGRPKPFTRDVLISCAKDSFAGFVGSLDCSLKDRGFCTKVVVDHRELKREAIEESRIFIIVLSDHYPTCPFRLDKFAEIVNEFGTPEGGRVLTVFYYVNTSDVRHQMGTYEIALAVHRNYVQFDRLEKWTMALTKAANIGGWPLNRSGNTYEYQHIEDIIQKVSKHVACSVGLHFRVQRVNDLLNSGPDDGVWRIGICGEAGEGKSTVARGVYHSNGRNRFDYYCILDKVGEYLSNHGLVDLARMLLFEMTGNNYTMLRDTDEGKSIVKQMLKQKKLFLVLEDIYDQRQLQVIVELTNWFSSRSKVIITAENNCLLQCHGIKTYDVERFKMEETLQLLSLKALNSKKLKFDYVSVLQRAETYASGCPFIVEVIGSYLCGKTVEECESALDQYEKIPNKEKQRIVQISFDALGKHQREMLIYIAFHLNRQKLTVVEDKLHRLYGVCPKKDIKVLLDKSLIKINEHGWVTLHDLTLNMVRDNARLQNYSEQRQLQLFEENADYGKQAVQPTSNDGSMICDLVELEENTEYGKQETQPASNDGSMIYDPMEFEYQLSYQNRSSSSSQDPS